MKKGLLRSFVYLLVMVLMSAYSYKRFFPNHYSEPAKATFSRYQHSIIEDFSLGTKAAYTPASAALRSGNWMLDNTLIARHEAALVPDARSARIRNAGNMHMLFDLEGVDSVSVTYSLFTGDAPASWQLKISKDGGNSFEPVNKPILVTVARLKTVSFAIGSEGKIRFGIFKTGGSKSRILIHNIVISDQDNNKRVSARWPGSEDSIHFTGSKLIGRDDSNLLLGNPDNALNTTQCADNYYIDRGHYVMSYSSSRATPNWVSWRLGRADLGTALRQKEFYPSNALPRGWYKPQQSNYKNSGFDKGHNCPSGDRTSNSRANKSTFYIDNIFPQAPKHNQSLWEHLERYCRDQVLLGNEVYIVMGSYGQGGIGNYGYRKTIDNGRITVPSNVWKVVVILPEGRNDLKRVAAAARIIAVDTPNTNDVKPNWMKYLCTVRNIERATGYNLFSALPMDVQDSIETRLYTDAVLTVNK